MDLAHQMMPLFDSDFLKRLPYLSLVSRRLGGGMLAAPVAESFPKEADGTELTGHRDYSPGDDYRMLDWSICARHDELVTRQYGAAADRQVTLLLDCSASMGLGEPSKFDAARRAAAALAYVALARLDGVSVVPFAGRMVDVFGPMRDKSRFLKLAGYLQALSPQHRRTDLAKVAEELVSRNQRRGVAVLLSDLLQEGDPPGLALGLDVLRRGGFQPAVVRVYDPAEARPRTLGDWELCDVESGACWHATLTRRHLQRFRRAFDEHVRSVRRHCATYATVYAEIASNLPLEELLLKAVGARSGEPRLVKAEP